MVFEKIENQKVLRSDEGRFTFLREEKVEKVFPAQIGEYLRGLSSLSYYSWFLHGQENGSKIRELVEREFSGNTVKFVREMSEKCRVFLCPEGYPVLAVDVWKELINELGKNNPLFVRGGNRARQLLDMCDAAPQRVLTVLLLAAAMNDFTEKKYEEVLSCWHLMDRDLAEKDFSQPREIAGTGAILYADGLRQEALACYRKAVKMLEDKDTENPAETDEEINNRELYSSLLYRIGKMLLRGDGCSADREEAEEYLTKSVGEGNVHAVSLLATLLMQEGKTERAEQILRDGAQAKDPACLRLLGNAYYTGDTLPGIKKDLGKAVRYYFEGACPDNLASGDAQSQYMLGRILEESCRNGNAENLEGISFLSGVMAEPSFWLEAAARGGDREAAALLNRLRWGIRGDSPESPAKVGKEQKRDGDPDKENSGRICILNSCGERNIYFAGTLPDGMYSIQICAETNMAALLRRIAEPYLCDENTEQFPEILLIALDDDEQKNRKDALEVLQIAAKLHAQIGLRAANRGSSVQNSNGGADMEQDSLFYLLSEKLQLYVYGNAASFSPVLDSLCTQMGDFYIPLYLCDPEQMTSSWLLDRMPLFIPCLKGNSSRMDTIIFGDHPGIVQLCKDAIAAAQINEIPFSLTVIGERADAMEEQFLTDCPGLDHPVPGIEMTKPVFIKMRPESRRLQELLSVSPKKEWTQEEKNLSMTLQAADYIVVYAADEDRNLTLSMFLREWYLKTDPSFGRLPFITAYCSREERAEQFRTLSAGAEAAGFSWYNNYDIQCFGTQRQLFSYQELILGRLEKRTRATHLIYYGIRDEALCRDTREGRANRHSALHDYFSRQYNHDSSRVNALSLNYRLFCAGIVFPDWHSYSAGVSQKILAVRFDEWLRAEDTGTAEEHEDSRGKESGKTNEKKEASAQQIAAKRLEILSMQEHDRWCRSMFSRGWMSASPAQMQTYIQRGCTRHQLYLAKLHPFLCAWEDLGEIKPVPTGMQRIYGYLMQQIRPDKEPSDIRGIDRDNIRMTSDLVRID